MAERVSTTTTRPALLVARRELREALAMKSYWISLVLTALALLAIIVIANLASGGTEDAERVVLAGPDSGAQVGAVERLGPLVGVELEVTSVADDATAEAAVRDDEADVAVLGGGARLATREAVEDTSRLGAVVNALRTDLALANGLAAAGLDPQQAADVRAAEPPPVEALDPEADADRNAGIVTVTNILLFIMLQTYGAWVLTGVTREKASRVVEVLLAVIRPIHLLAGKIAGIGAAALLHAAVLIVVAFVATRIVGADVAADLRAADLIVAIAWFLLGYALYCTALAAAGSLCARVEDAQGASFPILLPLLFAYLVSFSAVDGANTLLWVLAFIPPTAVLAMPTLYTIGEAPLWA
ncbi:MAG: ABC transporter permease, partial [Ilumatobacteraceae bacterium]